jgi:phage terminase small subunit
MPTTYKKQFTIETEEELMNMTREEACLTLNEKQRLFCEHYAAKHNAVLACRKAGYTSASCTSMGWRLRQNPDVNRYIAWLKLRISQEQHVNALDIVDHYARIAFADVTDFVSIKGGKITLIDEDKIDGQLVKSVKRGKDGVTIELYDKLLALQKLERYFDIMPADWKQKLEEKKLDLLKERLEIERIKAGQVIAGDEEDDGFIQALKESATETWSDDDE